jgi:aconitase A
MSYISLTTIVEPLNVVRMSVGMCRQANLCDKISTDQIVAASSIDDGTNAALFDDEENLEQVMLLKLLKRIHVGTQDPQHDMGLGAVLDRMLDPKDMFIIVIIR